MKVPKPKKQKSGAYRIQLRLDGESISITRPTATECKQEAQLIKSEYLAGLRQNLGKLSADKKLSEVVSAYIKAHEAVLSPSTVRSYKAHQKARFKDYQDKKLKDIDFQQMINDETGDKTGDKTGKSSAKTVKNGWSLVHSALKYAKYPIPEVKLPQVPVKEIAFLQPDEIKPFCKAIQGSEYEIPLLLMLHGLRLSEMLALTWDDIDLKKKLIHIRGAKVRGPEGLTAKKTNKNRTSTRILPIMIPQLETALQAVSDKTGFIDTHGQQTLLTNTKIFCEKAGVTVVSCHGLRHSFASLCYRIPGVSERQVMKWGGWSNIQTMHKIYIRLAAADETAAAEAVRKFFT